MRKRYLATAFAAIVATALLAVPAFGDTYQVNVTVKDGSCSFALPSVKMPNSTVLFHVINNGTATHGLMIWGVKSPMVKPQSAADVKVNFHKAGAFNYACTSGSYYHPKLFGKGIFKIRS